MTPRDARLFVDTSVWSLALRRDAPPDHPEITRLGDALTRGENVFTTGLVLQELLQGFRGPQAAESIIERFAALPFIDTLLASLCIAHDLVMLSTDRDFARIAESTSLVLWDRAPRT